MSYVIPAASNDLGLTPKDKAMLQSACFAGMMISGFFWGSISDTFGRKKLMIIGFLLSGTLNVLAGVFPILSLMIVFKFLSGFIYCGPSSIFAAYLSEVFLKKWRNIAVLSMGMYCAIGLIFLTGLAMLLIPMKVPSQIPFKSWQLFQMASSLPSLISGIGCIFFVESPKFMAEKGNHEEALKVCRTIYSINTRKPRNDYPIRKLKGINRKSKDRSNLSKFLEIFKPPFINKAFIVFLIHIGAFGLFNILRLWIPEIFSLVSSSNLNPEEGLCSLLQEGNLARSNFTSEQLKNEEIYVKMILVYFGGFIGYICFLLLVSFIGMKIMEFACFLVAGINSLIIPLISADYVTITMISISLTLYNICIFCNINIMVNIFPTRIRATSLTVLMLVARAGTFFFNFVFANLIYNYCQFFFYGFAFYSLVMAGLTLLIPQKPIEDKTLVIVNSSKLNEAASSKASPNSARNAVL
ncbi:synaptic vesicle 2-related protein isoform X2 [Halyomorpha halys]|uniref:synaptic vesicle 2-related protein isoform X2 n=1 Tax=Halyomorpha halys TaxID=286706 RepID=UPI0006D50C43|nr:synaptic vesicle 2-related protein-like [Halyomorpha halys]